MIAKASLSSRILAQPLCRCRTLTNYGPLQGIKVLELAGLAPAPFCGMVLADFGAQVVRIDPPSPWFSAPLAKGKQVITLDLKKQSDIQVLKRLSKLVDVIVEPYRPGVMERLGLGPSVLCSLNPQLIYARLSGYGHSGSDKLNVGHDINYLALSGILSTFTRESSTKPQVPANLLADFAGGGLLCAFGILLAIIERQKSQMGQIIDCSMHHGSAYLGSFIFQMAKLGQWKAPGYGNLLDGGAPFYDTYK